MFTLYKAYSIINIALSMSLYTYHIYIFIVFLTLIYQFLTF